MPAQKQEGRHILLADDSPGDVRLLQEALRSGATGSQVSVARDGVEALEFLRASALPPDLVLLDLNMPRKSGLEVLSEMKQDPSLRRIPVVMLSTSGLESDVARAYDLHANCYVTKPQDFEEFTALIDGLMRFWFQVAHLPGTKENTPQ